MGFMQHLREKVGVIEVASLHFPEFLWLLEKSLTQTPYVYYHKLTQAVDKYRSYYDGTARSCGPLLLQDNARKHKTKQTKKLFF